MYIGLFAGDIRITGVYEADYGALYPDPPIIPNDTYINLATKTDSHPGWTGRHEQGSKSVHLPLQLISR